MSHIHIPDGVLPLWLWASGWALALALVALASLAGRRHELRRRVPILAVISAIMLVAMSSEIVPIAYHMNLTVIAGILLGPALSIIAAFIVEVVLALLGHGGVTVLGLNTLIIAAEMILGWALFNAFSRLLARRAAGWAAGLATVLTLLTTTTLLVGIVALAQNPAATLRETGALDPSTLRFGNPFAEGAFRLGLLSPEEAPATGVPPISVSRFAAVVYSLGPIGWLIEALITAAIVGFVARVRPGLLWQNGPAAKMSFGRRPAGDEAARH
ncbi:MAG: energy-coupling factor ABC transporter permease [Coriobacteriales bacterium]|nr:energy-coupling factor ABC transporter permease [Coriobacteriales bacterium]